MRRRILGGRPVLVTVTALVALILIAPTLIVIPLSFNETKSFTLSLSGWSTQWYENFFTDPSWHGAAFLSLRIAPVVVILSTILGVAASLALVRGLRRMRPTVNAYLVAPMIIPGVIVAIGVYYVFLRWHLTQTYWGFVIAHTVMAIPFVVITVSASLQGVDRQLERAASVLGARPVKTFFVITLPLILPGVLTGAIFSFLISFDESIISLFLSGSLNRTLPVQLYQSVTAEIDPTGAAAATLLIAFSTILLLMAGTITIRRSKR